MALAGASNSLSKAAPSREAACWMDLGEEGGQSRPMEEGRGWCGKLRRAQVPRKHSTAVSKARAAPCGVE